MGRVGIVLGSAVAAILAMGGSASVAPRLSSSAATTSATSPPFNQCPAIGADTSCRLLINFNSSGTPTVLTDSGQPASFNADLDGNTLIGLQNDSKFEISAIQISSTSSRAPFAFDGDGACGVTTSPKPAACPFSADGYAGPGSSFSAVSAGQSSGLVDFASPILPGGSAWFSLEGAQTVKTLTVKARGGNFACRASAARLGGKVEPEVANAGDNPCKAASGALASVGPITALRVATAVNAGPLPASGDAATSQASVASLVGTVSGHVIDIEAASSQATVGCLAKGSGLAPSFTSNSSVASVRIDGQSFSGNQSQKIGAGPLVVYLNRTIFTASSSTLTQRAVEIDLNGAEVVVAGESTVNLIGNPCNLAGALPPGSCEPSSSLSVLVNGTSVVSYIPKAWWGDDSTTGVSAVNVEGASITATNIATPEAVNSCASNPVTGVTVCTANDGEVYEFKGTSLTVTLTSGGSGQIGFSGGDCTNCGVAMDAVHNQAVISESVAGQPGFQILDLNTNTFLAPVVSPAGDVSEDPLIDPTRNLLLSASEANNYEVANIADPSNPTFFENPVSAPGELDSSGEDCSTGIALAPAEFSDPSGVFIADLTQATFTPGSPSGVWSAPSQVQNLDESSLSAGASGIAVAQGTDIGIISGEFGGDSITAIQLPTTSGSGTPAILDWVTCEIGGGFFNGYDPHTLTAYQSPNGGDAIALLANAGATQLARVDLTQMLETGTVGRDGQGHACASGTLPASVVSFVSVP